MAIKSKKLKLTTRDRRRQRIRRSLAECQGDKPRISIFRSSKHTYAQIISDRTGETLVSASTLDPEVLQRMEAIIKARPVVKKEEAPVEAAPVPVEPEKKADKKGDKKGAPQKAVKKPAAKPGAGVNELKSTKSVNAARAVGLVLAERGRGKNIAKVVFDRNGYLYCGRVTALADGAREGGLQF